MKTKVINNIMLLVLGGCSAGVRPEASENIKEVEASSRLHAAMIGGSQVQQGDLTFEEFEKKFRLGSTSTEQSNPITERLSQTFQNDPIQGLGLLHQIDQAVVQGLQQFNNLLLEPFSEQILKSLRNGGRVILVGSGSSGRIALDLAAKWNALWKGTVYEGKVIGVIAGGPRALVRAKEGYEDSVDKGKEELAAYDLKPNDTVVLISASGSASHNVGAALEAAAKGCTTYYFYNSQTIPERTQELFDKYGVRPLLIDIGASPIRGSTRLGHATLALHALGGALSRAAQELSKSANFGLALEFSADQFVQSLETANRVVGEKLSTIAQFVALAKETFSNPNANFRRLHDETKQGYVTVLTSLDSARVTVTDTTEWSPTFSINPFRSIHEQLKKEAEIRAYLVGSENNLQAWEQLVGRLNENDRKEVEDLLVDTHTPGYGSYLNRPKGEGNFVLAVLKGREDPSVLEEMRRMFEEARHLGGKTGLLAVVDREFAATTEAFQRLMQQSDVVLNIEDIFSGPQDPLGLIATATTKQVLNMLSNGSMIGMNKVYGNRMIDVSPSNYKLVDRTMRIVQDIYSEWYPDAPGLNQQDLYAKVLDARKQKAHYEKAEGVYAPAVVRIALTMIDRNFSYEQAVAFLRESGEQLVPSH